MQSLYCPDCSSYLEGGDGSMQDCNCGWKQPEKKEMECPECGAMVDVSELESYSIEICYNCDTHLEFTGDFFIHAEDMGEW